MHGGFAWLAQQYIDVRAARKITINAVCESITQKHNSYSTIPESMPTTQPYHKSKANKTENCTRAKQVPGGMTSKAAHGKATMADTARQPKKECILKKNKNLKQTISASTL